MKQNRNDYLGKTYRTYKKQATIWKKKYMHNKLHKTKAKITNENMYNRKAIMQ